MRCVVNLLTGRFVASRGVSALPRMFEHKRGDSGEVRLEFCEGFTTATIPAGSEIIYGVKLRGEYDSAPLMTVTNFVLDAGIYSGTAAFDLDAIDAALNLDADATNDLETLDCMAELTWKVPGGGWLSTNTMHAVISNDVNRADDSLIERIADIPARWASATLSDLGVAGQVEAPIKIVVDGVALWFVIAAGDEDAGDGYVLNEGGLTAAEVLLEFEAYINDGEPVAAGSSFVLRDGTWDDFTALIVAGALVVSTNTAGVGGNALAVTLNSARETELEWDGATMTGGRASKSFDSGDFIATFEREPGSELTAEEQAIARADLGIGEAHTNAEVNTAIAASPATSATAMGLGTGDAPTFAGLNATGSGLVATFSSSTFAQVDISSTTANDTVLSFKENGVQKAKLGYDSSDSAFKIIAGTGSFAASNFVLTSTGNVGIGTTAPYSILHLYQNDSATSSTAGITIEQDGSGDAQLQFLLSGISRWIAGVDNSDGAKFKIGRGAGWGTGTDIAIDASGNVGIGTTSPAAKLEIAKSGEGIYLIAGGDSASNNRALTFTSGTAGVSVGALHTISAISGNGEIALATASAERLRITSTGNVGIGTTSPTAPIAFGKTVYGAPSSEGFYRIKFEDSGGVNNDIGIGQPTSGSLGFNVAANGYISFNEGTSGERVRIAAGGNVGIGTASPSAKLEVAGSSKFLGTTHHSWFNNGSSEDTFIRGGKATSKVYINDSHSADVVIASGGGNVGIGTTAPSDKLDVVGNINVVGSSARIGFNAGNMAVKDEGGYKLGFQTYNSTSGTITTKMVLDTNGNVGIGTTLATNGKLVIAESGTSVGSTIRLIGTNTSGSASQVSHITSYQPAGGAAEASALDFKVRGTDPYATPSTVMTLLGGGNVGIGTTTPAEKLDVVGNIKASGTVKTGSLTVAVATASSSATAVAAGAGASVYITDETGGATLAVSDGTVWRRVSDRAAIS
jgi:hypothetical protein